jgi:pimeloyl-ACP methyl ester carboxylesterase
MSERVQAHGLSVHHRVMGAADGAPLILLHGWGASSELLTPLGERLARRGVRAFMPDLPGFGQTPPPPEPWDVFAYARFALAYADAVGVGRGHWFGHSFGGRLCQIIAADSPERVEKLVLADSAGIRPAQGAASGISGLLKGVQRGLGTVGLGGLADGLAARYRQQFGSADYKAASGVMRDSFKLIIAQDLQAWAQRIAAPTLLVWGDQDQDTPLSDGQTLERLIPDAGLVVYAGAGHYSYLERADDVAVVMAQFIGVR